MLSHVVNITEFLNQVQYKCVVLDIERSKRIVARVSPAGQADRFPIQQLDNLLGNGPQLSAAGKLSMASQVRALREQLRIQADLRT